MYKILFILIFSINVFSVERPNIVIILTDDLGWGDVSYNGGPISTPNIDRFSEIGVQMNRFYSAPTCSPTRAALFTGINSLQNGMIRPFDNPTMERYGLPLKHKLLPEYLKDVGYETALVGKWHLGMYKNEYLPGNRGFDTTYGHLGGGIGYFDHAVSGRMDWHRNGEVLYEDGYSTNLIANEAIKIINEKNNESPLFLYVAFNAPHTPIQAEEKDIELMKHIRDKKERIYAANIFALDRAVGRIIDSINASELSNNTLIVFFSDNGPVHDIDPVAGVVAADILNSRGNTLGLKGSKGSTYEGGIRVPAIIYYKDVLEKSLSNQFFFTDDILPTILSAAKMQLDTDIFTGVDRWDNLITNNIQPPKNSITGNIIINDERALFNDNWKLYYRRFIYDDDSDAIFELYDIQNDPYETKDLSDIYPDIFNEMKNTLNEMPFVLAPEYFNATHAYLYGDQYNGVKDDPWLDRTYEEKEFHSSFVQAIVFTWIIFLAFKQISIPLLILFLIFCYYICSKIIYKPK